MEKLECSPASFVLPSSVVQRHISKLGSTNTWAKQNAAILPKNVITLVTADEQTAGRGRFQRKWISPPCQNIYASFCFFLPKNVYAISNIPQILAIAASETLEKLGFKPKLKWPNDLLLSNKKVAGILCETTSLDDTLCFIAGIGLNVNMKPELLAEIDRPATSLLSESGAEFDISKIIELLQDNFVSHLQLFFKEGLQPFLDKYRKRLLHSVGQKIQFYDNMIIWEGVYVGIREDGSLDLKMDNGEIKNFMAGEICHKVE